MRRLVMLAVILANSTGFAAGLISNGSFEDDGAISNIVTRLPFDWDVSIPAKFSGEIVNDWYTDGDYSLKLISKKSETFAANEYACISQNIDLTDVEKLYFDINLRGYKYGLTTWNGNKVRAFVKIDDADLWVSEADFVGLHYDVNVDMPGHSGIHTMKFGIRVIVSEKLDTAYWAQWDFLKFDSLCGGYGHFEGDINRDCYVNFEDMYVLADNWLRTDLTDNDYRMNLHSDNIINLQDFAILADQWLLCSNWQDDNCVRVPLDLDGDLNQDGIVNFVDYAMLMNEPDADYNDIKAISEQWLERSWLFKN